MSRHSRQPLESLRSLGRKWWGFYFRFGLVSRLSRLKGRECAFLIKLVQSILYIDKIVPFFINPYDHARITQLMGHCDVNVAYFIADELTEEKRIRPVREGTFLYYTLADIEELLVSLVGMSMKKFSFEEKMQERLFTIVK